MEAGYDINPSAGGGRIDGTLLARYVAGRCSAREKEAVEQWVIEEEGRAATMSELKQVWELAERPLPATNVEAALKQLHEKRRAEERPTAPGRPASTRRARRPRRRNASAPLFRICAVVAVVALAAVLLAEFGFLNRPESPDVWARVYQTEKGQRALVTLPDGSVVQLNVGSTLEVPAGFAVGERAVRLKGEAYFDVAKAAGRPFVIHTARATVRVLGTAFDVRAYAHEQAARVVVTEGRVAVRPKVDAQPKADPQQPTRSDTLQAGHPAVLGAHQMAVVAEDGLVSVHHHVDLDPYLAWTEGRLIFEDAPFEEVVTDLERWYGLKIDVTFPYEAVRPFNGTFDDEPLGEVLTIVAASLNLTYERQGRHVTFTRATSAAFEPDDASRSAAPSRSFAYGK